MVFSQKEEFFQPLEMPEELGGTVYQTKIIHEWIVFEGRVCDSTVIARVDRMVLKSVNIAPAVE
eukprot:3229992-Prorocentrum_lima.AAC.1